MAVLLRAAAAAAMVITTACGASNATGGVPSYSPGPPVPGASFVFEAENGAHPVDDRSGEWISPASEIMLSEYEGVVRIDAEDASGFEYIVVELNGPNLAPLDVGHYPDARNRDLVPDGPGMLVISGSLGCGDAYGEFTVDRIERDATGRLVAFDAGFTQRCGAPDGPALYGRVHYQS